jgi:SAM-dependent methyltransferase
MATDRDWEDAADRLAARALADGAPTRWFDELWTAGERDEVDVPWDRSAPHPFVVEQAATLGDVAGRSAVVVGAGLGADAEHLSERGWRTVAFDVSPAAVRLARDRHPATSVDYQVADLLELPSSLTRGFDLVVEVFTVQALPPSVRATAIRGVRSLLAPGGTLLVVAVVRPDDESQMDGPPWLLDRPAMTAFAGDDVAFASLATVPNPMRPDARPHWVGVLRRDR